MMIEPILTISLFCFGLYAVTRPGYLLGDVAANLTDWLNRKNAAWIVRPIYNCTVCMSSLWGLLLSLLMGLQWGFIPVVCLSVAGLNKLITTAIEAIENYKRRADGI